MSKANPTPAEYRAEISAEVAELEAATQTQYTRRRIQTLRQRLDHMYDPQEESE